MHITYYLGISAGAAVVFAAPSIKQDVGVSSASLDKLIRGITGDYTAPDGTKYAAHRPEPFEYDTALALVPDEAGTDANIQRRCANNRAVVVDRIDRFIDWDMQLSPVVRGPAEIEVQSGHSISNTVEVTGGIAGEKSFIMGDLGIQVGVSYSKSWTSDTRIHPKVSVDAGMHGVVVINPAVTRRYGRVMVGCLGSQTEAARFQADDYRERDFNGIKFVDGEIGICQKPVGSPLTRCEGSGEFIEFPP